MAYKSILTLATSPEGIGPAVDAAAKIAQAFDGHLEALALGVDQSQLGYSYVGAGALVLEVAMQRAAEDAAANRATLKAELDKYGADLRFSLEEAVAQQGGVTHLVAGRARYADLVVLPRPYGGGNERAAEAVVEASMFEGSTPVLVVPPTGLPSAEPKRIVLAWNQSNEALTAARRALPLLKRADLVTITVVDPPVHGPERSDPGGQLCQYLTRHGVNAEVAVLARTMPRISEVLARQCQDLNADLMVMGAYGHSRFREAILGGATRNALEQTAVPVLMAH